MELSAVPGAHLGACSLLAKEIISAVNTQRFLMVITLLATLFALGAVFSSATIIFMKVF